MRYSQKNGDYVGLFLLIGAFFFPFFSYGQQPIHIDELQSKDIFFIMDRCEFAFSNDTGQQESVFDAAELDWFSTDRTRYQNFGRPKTKLWMRFSVANSANYERELVFVFGNHTINEVTLYQYSDSGLHHLHTTGSGYPFSSRPYPLFVYAFPLQFEANETKDYVLSIDAKQELTMFVPMMLSPKQLKYQNDRSYLSIGTFVGIVLVCGVFNFFLYVLIRERIHLLYALYALVTIWCLLSMVTMDFQFIFPDFPQFIYASRFSSNFLYFAFLLLIMQSFLGQTATNSKLYWPAKVLIGVNVVFFMLEWIAGVPRWPVEWSAIHYNALRTVHLFNLLIVLLSCVEKIRQGHPLAWLFFSALFVVIVGGVLTIVNTIGWLDWHSVLMPPSPIAVGVVIEAVMICFGILYRYHLLKQEKERLSQELQHQKLSVAKEILRVEEEEKTRFARNLHDELGGNLAALKVAIQGLGIEKPTADRLNVLVDRTSEATRTIAHDIMPPEFEKTALDRLLAGYFNRLTLTGTIQFDFLSDEIDGHFTKQQELMIYRIVLELSTNIIQHSKATEATLQLISYDEYLEIMVEDNGIGFDLSSSRKGMGLRNIEARILYFHGSLTVDSGERGTTIIITIPKQQV